MKKTEDINVNEMPLESETSVIKRTKALLEAEPKIKVKIRAMGKDDTAPVPVVINEYCLLIKKGEYVEVPESVAKMLEEANYI